MPDFEKFSSKQKRVSGNRQLLCSTMQSHAIVITGAGKGLGKAIALAFAAQVPSPVHFVLTGRGVADLKQTKLEIQKFREPLALSASFNVVIGDIGDVNGVQQIADKLFCEANTQPEAQFISTTFINNAGSLGALHNIGFESDDILPDLVGAVDVNIIGSMFLTSQFVKRSVNSTVSYIF